MTRYANPHLANSKRSFWNFFLWKMGYFDDDEPWEEPPAGFSYPVTTSPFERNQPSALWIGHSTFLIELGGIAVLTDPVWDKYCAPLPIPLLKRQIDPPIDLQDLPPIDYILLSHNHYDHLDARVVKYFATFYPETVWIVPVGLKGWLLKRNIRSVFELNWWERFTSSSLTITATPTQHFSGRGLWDRNRSLWNGYVFETGKKRFYFTGDTGYNPVDFKAIGEVFPSMDLSLIPIGTYSPKRFMETVHISPYEAVKIHQDVRSLFSLGMHWKTFCLSEEPMNRPPYDLFLAMKEKEIPFETFLPVEVGVYVNW